MAAQETVEVLLNNPKAGDDRIILPDAKAVGDVIVLLTEFAYIIYRLASEQ